MPDGYSKIVPPELQSYLAEIRAMMPGCGTAAPRCASHACDLAPSDAGAGTNRKRKCSKRRRHCGEIQREPIGLELILRVKQRRAGAWFERAGQS